MNRRTLLVSLCASLCLSLPALGADGAIDDPAAFARQLAQLRHGDGLDTAAVAHLSASVPSNGTKDLKNAQALSGWLADVVRSARLADQNEAAAFMAEVNRNLRDIVPEALQSAFDAKRGDVVTSLQGGKLSWAEAIELFAYGDVTNSTVTGVITHDLRN